ncbi:hypothetical protein J6590_052560 [Homalodisca vitripennis]|nr:hypothetical protein J6590_052560 [Homalodisca vitripennis]
MEMWDQRNLRLAPIEAGSFTIVDPGNSSGNVIYTFNPAFPPYKRALRVVWGMRPDESCRERFRSSGILTLASLLIFH